MFLHLHIIDAATKMRFSKIMSWENTHKSKWKVYFTGYNITLYRT